MGPRCRQVQPASSSGGRAEVQVRMTRWGLCGDPRYGRLSPTCSLPRSWPRCHFPSNSTCVPAPGSRSCRHLRQVLLTHVGSQQPPHVGSSLSVFPRPRQPGCVCGDGDGGFWGGLWGRGRRPPLQGRLGTYFTDPVCPAPASVLRSLRKEPSPGPFP